MREVSGGHDSVRNVAIASSTPSVLTFPSLRITRSKAKCLRFGIGYVFTMFPLLQGIALVSYAIAVIAANTRH